MKKTCDVCQGGKVVRLATYQQLGVVSLDDDTSVADVGWKEFPCPQCVPMVPYKRVRAMKVAAAYPPEDFGRYQAPIERGLAARFGEYLMREGLIRFTTDALDDFKKDRITVTAHLGVVTRKDAEIAGAVPEVAFTAPPTLPRKLTRQERERARVRPGAVAWTPNAGVNITQDLEEDGDAKNAIADRFSGLEL